MIKRSSRFDEELNYIGNKALRAFSHLLSPLTDSQRMFKCLEEIRTLLDSLVLGTGDYGLAVLRIKNAQRFFAADEFGAARLEIRLLKGELIDQLQQKSGQVA